MAALSPAARAAALAALPTADLDLLVVGGGITGAGIARDAALRGLRVVLLEADDFAKGSSSRSTKLLHGGVRYLAMGQLSLVREALHERSSERAREKGALAAEHLIYAPPAAVANDVDRRPKAVDSTRFIRGCRDVVRRASLHSRRRCNGIHERLVER
jgi:glycine/D-amino acid oxidase-like deaminating enzyme